MDASDLRRDPSVLLQQTNTPTFSTMPRSRRRRRIAPLGFEIPVKFVGSFKSKGSKVKTKLSSDLKGKTNLSPPRQSQMEKGIAAVKIQKVFRGFSVRKSEPLKNLKTIARSKANMKEIRQRITDLKFGELIRRNEKERLKITEELMEMLLKLDAIPGVNIFVRESRKAVVRELVNLQERVDAIVTQQPMGTEGETVKSVLESALPSSTSSSEIIAAMDLQAARSNITSSPSTVLDSIKKKIMLLDKENKHNKEVLGPKFERKVPEDFVSMDENKKSSYSIKDYLHNVLKNKGQVGSDVSPKSNSQDVVHMEMEKCSEKKLRSEMQDEFTQVSFDMLDQIENHEQTNDEWEMLEKLVDESNPRDGSEDTVESLREENTKLKKVIQYIYRNNQMQNGILANICKRLEDLEKRTPQSNINGQKSAKGKRKRSLVD